MRDTCTSVTETAPSETTTRVLRRPDLVYAKPARSAGGTALPRLCARGLGRLTLPCCGWLAGQSGD